MKDSETLLELYRNYTDKEKLGWIIKDYNELKKKHDILLRQNENLRLKNEKLNKQVKEDELKYPSQLNGEKYISVRSYFKLRERYKQIEDRFWEVVQELNKLKEKSDIDDFL